MNYLSDEFVLGMLAKVQPLQADVLKAGYTCHVDAGIHESPWTADHGKTYISLDFSIFLGGGEIEEFDFTAYYSEDELEAEFARLKAFIKNRL